MTPLKILLMNTQMEMAGAQKAMLTLARGLQQRGHTVTVATLYDKGGYVARLSREYGVPIVDLRMKSARPTSLPRRAWDLAGGLVRMWRLMRAGRYDVLQTFSPQCNTLGPLLAFAAGIPVRVSSQRNTLSTRGKWFLILDRWVANSSLVARMVAISEGVRRFCIEVEKIRPDKLECIRNGIDTTRFSCAAVPQDVLERLRGELGLKPDSFNLISVGRLDPQKGHRYLVEAMPSILQAIPQAELLLAGDGSLRRELERQAQSLGVASAVHFLGVRDDVRELLALSDMLVLPSLWEGLGNSLLEAMAMDVPIVATNVGGIPEALEDGGTGRLVPPQDAHALRQAICLLYERPDERHRLAAAARQSAVTHFSEPAFVDAFERLYKELARVRHPAPQPKGAAG